MKKPSPISSEVRSMVDLRHQAEQRGEFSPLGRLLSLDTSHGLIQFGTQQGECVGPDLGQADFPPIDGQKISMATGLLVLGAWEGLPSIRNNSQTPCPKCVRICEVCAGSGKKQCEGLDCGGRGYTLGKWISCSGPGCHAETGQYKPNCVTCGKSDVKGMVREHAVCMMCKDFRVHPDDTFSSMTCSACRGVGKRSTGRVDGSLDYRLPTCKACAGTTWKGEFAAQDVAKFTNAILDPLKWQDGKKWPTQTMLALGPIQMFTLKDFGSGRVRTFGVLPDSAGDYLMLLVPKVLRGHPKAYLVGGVVRESGSGERVA